jgi:hypothetical protein
VSDPRRASDRWITPGVVIVGILVVGGLVAMTIAGVTYMQVRGIDPDPMIRMVMEIGGSASAFLTLLLTLISRKTATKIERNTGQLASETAAIADRVYEDPAPPAPLITSAPRGQHHAETGKLPPVPPPDRPARC